MKHRSRLDYAYAVGRAQALGASLIPRPVFLEAADAANAAASLKHFFDNGNYPEDLLRVSDSGGLDALLDREDDVLAKTMAELLLDSIILRIYHADSDPGKALVLARSLDEPFIRDYIRHRLDLANIKCFFRMKYLGYPRKKFEEKLLEGGFVEKNFYGRVFEMRLTEAASLIPYPDYRAVWEQGALTLEERETFVSLERGIEDLLMNYLREAKKIVFGPEPVYAYGLARKRELSLIRLVGVGKLSGIPAGLIKERVSETYV
jgi:hypothetical protein